MGIDNCPPLHHPVVELENESTINRSCCYVQKQDHWLRLHRFLVGRLSLKFTLMSTFVDLFNFQNTFTSHLKSFLAKFLTKFD